MDDHQKSKEQLINDMRSHPLFINTSYSLPRAIVGLPLKMGQQVVGVTTISRAQPFSKTEPHPLYLVVNWAEVGGMPLGIGLGAQFGYQEISLTLSSGDLIILTSDGVVEANNAAREMFGFERLEQAVAVGPSTSAEAMLAHLQAEVAAFVGDKEPHDDLTIVVMQIKA